MEVTITNNGGYITIDDNRDPAFASTLDVLKDGLDLLQFGDVLRIVYKDGTWFESLATQSEVVGLSGSITPSDGLEFYAAMWDVLADYGTGSGGGTGDMTKAVYDTDNDGVVDSSETVQIIVRNSTGSTLTKGQIVYLSGATGNRPNALLAKADAESTSSKTIGWIVSNIANNADGYVGISGTQHNLDTSAFTAGDRLWLSSTTAGGMVTTAPTQPNHSVFIGYVARSHPTQGRIVFLIQNGYELGELHDVLISSIANNEVLTYESSTGLWKNKALATIVGYTPENVANKSTSVITDQASDIKYPSVKAVFDWATSVFTTTSAVATQITTALTGYATQTWVNSQGFITNVISSLGYTPENVANKSTSIASDSTSNTKYPSVKAVFDWATSTFALNYGVPTLVNQENYPTTSNSFANLYVASVGKLYVCNNLSNTVLIYNVSTGALLNTVSVTNAFRPLLASNWATGSAVDEVWITSTTATTISRISLSGDNVLGTITGVTANGFDIVNFSSTKCFITVSSGTGAMLVINPTTLSINATVTTNMSAFPSGMAYNGNGSSSQNGFIVVACQSGVLIFNPSTNAVSTTILNPSGAISTGREIRYNATKDKYYVANSVGNTFVELSIASSTTFTASNAIRNIAFAFSVQIDESAGYIFVSSVDSSGAYILVNVFNFTTLALLTSFKTNASITVGATESSISIDASNKKLYVIGRRTGTNSVSVVKYY